MAPQAVNLVNLENVSKAYTARTLMDKVSLGLSEGDRIGVVGRNGGGKSTLLRVLAKLDEPDSGRVTHTGGLRIAFVGQHDTLDPAATIRHELVADKPDHEWLADARVRDVITGLFGGTDFPAFPEGMDTRIGPLSGGERRRVALAKALINEHDLLLLDEPTNHLDVEGIAWLARHLATAKPALLTVTHDRWFLDAVTTRTWEVVNGQVLDYDGGYSAYVLARAERQRQADTEWDRKQNLLRKELAWLRRGAPARTSKPKFRIDAANQLIAAEPPARDSTELQKFATSRLGRTVYELEDVSYAVGDGVEKKELFKRVTWQLGPGERLGLIGVNGSGKSSLVRLLLGEAHPDSGRVVTGLTVKPAHLSQEVAEIDPTWRVLEAVEKVHSTVEIGKGKTLTAGQLLERFGFAGEKQWTRVGDLSGGERRRLQLLRLLMDAPNVLLLDEPTNDLDIDTLTAFEDILDGWPGSLLVVSHDRYFLERTTDRVAALYGDGRIRLLPGGVDEYLAHREQRPPEVSNSRTTKAPAQPSNSSSGGTGSREDRAVKKELARIERRLDKIAELEAKLHGELSEIGGDYLAAADADAKLRELHEERLRLEDEWLSLSE
ncbi:ATP-binding cassette subfamily F protein uup [Catenulispora sp. MAP12-49]|jgi:ABC transport system ATP-binding/permease protein|uniref:ABC-F family ATP-binding cassette domain-containing protein n=1 Tax=unclassified Catenulispora TaxID=414885 RepID=UPI00351644EB